MTDPNAPLREVHRWMRVSTPVNKAASSGLRGRLPQIAGPLMIGALGVGALGAGIAWHARHRAHPALRRPRDRCA